MPSPGTKTGKGGGVRCANHAVDGEDLDLHRERDARLEGRRREARAPGELELDDAAAAAGPRHAGDLT